MIVHGFDESINTCDCCGRTDLKGTFTVENSAGEYLHYGCVCVTRHTNKTKKQINKEIADKEESLIDKCKKEVQSSKEYMNHSANIYDARQLGLSGLKFKCHVSDTLESLRKLEKRVSEKYGIPVYKF